jgi:O-antigen/teichoic acid export membrane protein
MFMFTSVDVLLARSLMTASDAGQYAGGAILIKIAFWLPHAITVAAFPGMSLRQPGALRRSATLMAGLGVVVVTAAAVLGPRVMPVVLGSGYDIVASSPALFVLVGVIQSLAYLIVVDRLADRDRNAVWAVWGAVLLVIVLALTVGRTPVTLAWSVAFAATMLCLAGLGVSRLTQQAGSNR